MILHWPTFSGCSRGFESYASSAGDQHSVSSGGPLCYSWTQGHDGLWCREGPRGILLGGVRAQGWQATIGGGT